MACNNCGDKISGVCKVCELLDGDDKVKVVKYCNLCGVFICNSCNLNLERRLKAFIKTKVK
jgi:hypothetical protein